MAWMRRRLGALVPLEISILSAAAERSAAGDGRVHGFELARHIAEADRARALVAHGTLYKALGRLVDAGLLTSEWEDPAIALDAGRPRRRFYEITDAGSRALAAAQPAPRQTRARTHLQGGIA